MNDLLIHNVEEKLKKEFKSEDPNDPATMIQKKVCEALICFCKQSKNLAEQIISSDKKFYDCCKEILKDTKSARYISDFDAYDRAVKFYCPSAIIEFKMNIKSENTDGTESISLLDLLG